MTSSILVKCLGAFQVYEIISELWQQVSMHLLEANHMK